MTNCNHVRLPAEWEYDCDILLAWPHDETDWAYMLDEVRQCYVRMIEAFVSVGHRVILLTPDGVLPDECSNFGLHQIIPVRYLTNDTWTRDYGPISFDDVDGGHLIADFKFNGWGLKFASDRDNLVTTHLLDSGLLIADCERHLDFVLEGGGIESDGGGSVLTTSRCQMSLNRNGGRFNNDIDAKLKKYLHADRLLYLDHGYLAGDDTDSHIDTLARFAPGDTIIYVGCNDVNDEHFKELSAMADEIKALRTPNGAPYNLIELPLPDPIYDEDGLRLPATYANFLATSKAVFLPVYGQKAKDMLAEQMIKIAFDVPVITVDCRALIQQHGSLHCATMQLPKYILSI